MPDNSEILERIEALIRAVYKDRTVDPWHVARDRARFFEALFRKRLPTWPIRNQTDPMYGGSTAIAFLLHPGRYIGVPTRDGVEVRIRQLGGECFQALLEISHLGPYARVRFTKESIDPGTSRIVYDEQDEPFREDDNGFLASLKRILEDEGIEILSREILDHRVPDVQLDVTEAGSATVYHCLFDEE